MTSMLRSFWNFAQGFGVHLFDWNGNFSTRPILSGIVGSIIIIFVVFGFGWFVVQIFTQLLMPLL